MKRFLPTFFLFLVLAVANCPGYGAARLSPQAEISLLTCSPGKALYSKFGHTAIRVFDPAAPTDLVFNYGMFSFYADHFYSRFVKGETDYELGINSVPSFYEEYSSSGRQVYEQVLNLTQQEKEDLLTALLVNYRPENRVYRYNFVYDNCATRPYYLFKECLHGTLDAPEFATRQDTYRQIIDHYTGKNSWAAFGINLIFGKDADCVMTTEQRMFLPEELMNFISGATVRTDAETKKMVGRESVGTFEVPAVKWFGSPAFAVLIVVLLTILISVIDLKRGKISYAYDAFWFFIYGVLGLLMFYLSFCSLHPLVKHNFNLLLFNPLMFIPFVLCLFRKGRQLLLRMRWVVIVYYVLALLVWLLSGQAKHIFVWVAAVHFLRMVLVWYAPNILQNRLAKPAKTVGLIFMFTLASGSAMAQTQATPRLLVTVVVDGLQPQNLARLENYWGQGGIRTLWQEGTYFPYVYFPHSLTGGMESVATVCTGTTPYYHGIMEDYVFHPGTRTVRHSLTDLEQNGIGTNEQLSPANLLATTFADELRLTNGSKSKIYAVGIDAAETILLAGHTANAAAWIDDVSMRWVSTSFYAEGLPACADEMNMDGRFMQIAERVWSPRMGCEMYLSPTEQELKKGFSYQPTQVKNAVTGQTILKTTPSANALVVELALKIQETAHLGEDLHPDMLMLQLTTKTPAAPSDYLSTAEQEDMYMRLNQDLGLLLDQLVKRVGKDHLLVAVIGKPHTGRTLAELGGYGISAGYFNTERSAALINTYLMALYGHERWVDGSYDNNIYLNRLLIEQRKLDLENIQEQVAAFLMEFEGVHTAYTVSQLRALAPDETDMGNKLQNSCHLRTCGDVIFTLQPGWVVTDDRSRPIDRISEANPMAPFFLWGMNIGNRRIDEVISAAEIAPYLCKRMSVSLPNACIWQESITQKTTE